MNLKTPIRNPSENPFSKMNLVRLREELKESAVARPLYDFRAVESTAEESDYSYVFWLDLMGAKNMMKLSLPRAARSVMRIHVAALLAKRKHPELEIHPVMDGVYGFVNTRELLETVLSEIIASLAHVFVHVVPAARFMVRAGVAFGPIIAGKSLAAGAEILEQNVNYLHGTAIGMGITHAYEAENSAPPFGVFIHESARAFAPSGEKRRPYESVFWRWFNEEDPLTWATRRALVNHFAWLEKNPIAAQYEIEAMKRHKGLATEYFSLHALPRLEKELKK
jgi:hypothetical protein